MKMIDFDADDAKTHVMKDLDCGEKKNVTRS